MEHITVLHKHYDTERGGNDVTENHGSEVQPVPDKEGPSALAQGSRRRVAATEDNRGSEPWQDVPDVRSGGSLDVAMAKLAAWKLKRCSTMTQRKEMDAGRRGIV